LLPVTGGLIQSALLRATEAWVQIVLLQQMTGLLVQLVLLCAVDALAQFALLRAVEALAQLVLLRMTGGLLRQLGPLRAAGDLV